MRVLIFINALSEDGASQKKELIHTMQQINQGLRGRAKEGCWVSEDERMEMIVNDWFNEDCISNENVTWLIEKLSDLEKTTCVTCNDSWEERKKHCPRPQCVGRGYVYVEVKE